MTSKQQPANCWLFVHCSSRLPGTWCWMAGEVWLPRDKQKKRSENSAHNQGGKDHSPQHFLKFLSHPSSFVHFKSDRTHLSHDNTTNNCASFCKEEKKTFSNVLLYIFCWQSCCVFQSRGNKTWEFDLWTFSYKCLVVVRNGNSVVASKIFADLTKGVGINLYCSNNTCDSHRRFQRPRLMSDHNI